MFITDIHYGAWLVSYATYGKDKFECYAQYGVFPFFDTTGTVGELTITYFCKRLGLYNFYDYLVIASLIYKFCLPGMIVFVCMILQMFYIKRSFGRSENPLINTANHVNLTVFLISFLYTISVSVFSYCLLLQHVQDMIHGNTNNSDFEDVLLVFGKYTLPLLNAALFPTILILRKPDLKAEFKNYIMKILLLPLTILYKLRSVVLRRRGYTAI